MGFSAASLTWSNLYALHCTTQQRNTHSPTASRTLTPHLMGSSCVPTLAKTMTTPSATLLAAATSWRLAA